ncbi:MAG: protein kinase [Verrucomicrobiaceae bacterium]|nr:protein kinase [Verrucomicrobiaceae bacterium]
MPDDPVTNDDTHPHHGDAGGGQGAFAAPSLEELGVLLPQYAFHSLIGVGGMGAVYLARQISLDRPVAIKVMAPLYEDQAAEAAQFITEARAMAKLVHPHIVAVFDFGQTSAGHLFLVMEYIEGTDLHRLIHAGGVDAALAHGIIGQLCDALQYAHDHGVAHRDIKPANILITHDLQVKVADFGLAKDLTDTTAADDGMGTPDYASPERLVVGAQVDHRADIYSLGIVIHEMLSGETPRQAARHGGAKLPDAFVGVMSKCLMVEPARRYQSAREVKAALDAARRQAQRGAAPPAVRASQPMLPRQVVRHVPANSSISSLGWVVACLLLVGGAAWYWLTVGKQGSPAASTVPSPSAPAAGGAPPSAPSASPSPSSSRLLVTPTALVPLPAAFLHPLEPSYAVPDGPAGEVKTLTGHTGMIRNVIIMPDQRRVISSSVDGTIRIWDLVEGKELAVYDMGGAFVTYVIADPQFRQLAGAGASKAMVWDLATGKGVLSAPLPSSTVYAQSFSPDGSSVLVSTWRAEQRLLRWTPSRGPGHESMTGWKATIKGVATLPDGRFVSVGCDPENNRWVAGEAVFGRWDSTASSGTLPSVTRAVFAVAASPDGRTIAVADSTIDLIDSATGRLIRKLTGLRSTVSALKFVDGGRLLLAGGLDKTMVMFDCESGREASSFSSSYYAFRTIAVSRDERWAVTGGVCDNPVVNKEPEGFALHVWRLPSFDTIGTAESRTAFARRQLANLEAADPELARLKSAVEAEAKIATVEQMAAQIAELNGKYAAALKRNAANAAPLEQKAMLDEAARIAGGMFIDPAADDPSLPAALRSMRGIYRQQVLLIETTRNEAATRAAAELAAKLQPLLDSREASGDKPGAARVRALMSAGVQPVKIADLFGAFGTAAVRPIVD